MKILEKIAVNNPCYKSGRKINIQGIMLHSVGCPQPSAEVFANIWNLANADVCVHAVVDACGNTYQLLPWNHRAWHCGASANNTHISVEMTEPSTIRYTGGANWVEVADGANTKKHVLATYSNAVELFAYLCKQYNLNPLGDGVIISHSEGYKRGVASGHADVEHIWNKFGLTMNQFRKDVNAAMNGGSIKIDSVVNGSGATNGIDLNRCKEFIDVYGRCKELQEKLNKLNYHCGTVDGIFGSKTLNALLDFQRKNGLAVDGLAGTATFAKLDYIIKGITINLQTNTGWVSELQKIIGVKADNIPGPITLGACPLIKYGCNNGVVKLLQEKLNALGYNSGIVDGIFGQGTKNAVIRFQRAKNLVDDGVVGANTWRKLLGL